MTSEEGKGVHERRSEAEAAGEVDPALGQVVAERYRIDALIAAGGMARVYRAHDTRLARDVALKVLSPPYADGDDFTRRFLEEARAAASITHPSLVHVYDSGSDGMLHFIAMELLDRHRSLRDVLRLDGPLPTTRAIGMGRELLAGLRMAHERGLVHCDVKTGNVMLGPGPAKLIDFGIARSRGAAEAGTSMGSLRYMSPEQLRGERLTPASDLFSLGVVLYEALSGRLPFGGETPQEVAAAHARGGVRPPSTIVNAVPAPLDAAILRALRQDPSARFESAETMDRALEASLKAQDEEETREIRAPTPPRPSGYVPPVARPAGSAPAAGVGAAGRAGPRPSVRHQMPRRSRAWSSIGTLLVLAAAALVVVFVVLPLLGLRGFGAGPDASSPPTTPTPVLDPGTVLVPNAIGLGKEAAIEAATAAGLNWTIRCSEDLSQPEGIVDQEPPAGESVAPGSRFTMFSSRFVGWCDG